MARYLVLMLVVACSSPTAPPAATPRAPAGTPTTADGRAAYDAKAFPACAAIYERIAATAPAKRTRRDAHYDAACCHALAGKPDAAFAALDLSITSGLRDSAQLDQDHDLDSLHSDPRWPHLAERIAALIAAASAAMKDPALRVELLELVKEDQAARMAMIAMQAKHGDDPAILARVEASDRKTTARMKEVIAKYGWAGTSIVGEDGANAGWLLIQHADADPAFQKQCLAAMERLLGTDEISDVDYAYLYDRVAVAEHRLQRYGTQFAANHHPSPIEDESHVDDRRRAFGMPTMAEYTVMMTQMYGPPD